MGAELKRLEMQLRARAPAFLRQWYRMARSLHQRHPYSRELPAHLVEGCELCTSRVQMLDRLPKHGIVAELGTYRGDFARLILAKTAPRELHLIDIDYSQFEPRLLDNAYVVRHQGLTSEVISTFPDAHFDWIYIDADHSYEGALRDAELSAAKLKSGGLMIFNDFAHIDLELGRYGVHRAVTDFVIEKGWRLRFFALHPAALYDVAIVKP